MTVNVDKLAQEIRRVDGDHSLGAAALAEALLPFLKETHDPSPQQHVSGSVRYKYDPIAGKMRYFGSSAPTGWIGDGETPTGHATPDFIADYFDKTADERDEIAEHFNPDLTDYMREAARLLRKAYVHLVDETGLSNEDQKSQAMRCSCNGTDDYCPCQNVPDAATTKLRAAVQVALDCGSLPIKEGRELEAALAAATPSPQTNVDGSEAAELKRINSALNAIRATCTTMECDDRHLLGQQTIAELRDAAKLINELVFQGGSIPAPQDHALAGMTGEIVNLVIAAREAFDCAFLPEDESRALDKALEPFASKIRYANEPALATTEGSDNA